MNKPLTIKELKSLEVGDWVWVVSNTYKSLLGYVYKQDIELDKSLNEVFAFSLHGSFWTMDYSNYGKTWLAYKNKEQAETPETETKPMTLNEAIDHLRALIPKLNCGSCADEHKQLLVWLTELRDIKQAECKGEIVELPCKIETLHVDDTVYYIQEYFNDATLKHERQVKRTVIDYIAKDYIEVNNGVWLSTDKFWLIQEEAERRLAELTKE